MSSVERVDEMEAVSTSEVAEKFTKYADCGLMFVLPLYEYVESFVGTEKRTTMPMRTAQTTNIGSVNAVDQTAMSLNSPRMVPCHGLF